MKRLLLPLLAAIALPIAANAFPWDKKDEDIIIKTDLDEEYIVKDSTVTITPWSKLDAIKAVQKNHPIDKCLNSGIRRNVCLVDLFSERAISHVEAEDALIKADISTPMNIIKFRPIFVDLNGNKTANNYFNIACINPKLVNMDNTGSILKALDFSISKLKAEIPDFNSGLAIESVKEAVCEKYNNFVDSDFSIDDPAIVKRKYRSGVGFDTNKKKVKIIYIWKGSEAEKYLKLKDEVLEFNDIKVSEIKMEDRIKILAAGDTDKPLRLLIKRKGKELEFVLKREKTY